MAVDGDTRLKFGRNFTFINPDATVGPGTWRLSTIDEIAGGGTGGGGSINVVSGTDPIVSILEAAGEVDISIDITKLGEKA
jgi:hypothetical protein